MAASEEKTDICRVNSGRGRPQVKERIKRNTAGK